VADYAPLGHCRTSTFIAALRVTGLTAPGVLDGPMDGESFLAYVDQILALTLRAGDIVIADNLAAHHVDGVRDRIEAATCVTERSNGFRPESCKESRWRDVPADWLTTLPRYAACDRCSFTRKAASS
jgi:hypothetical protein